MALANDVINYSLTMLAQPQNSIVAGLPSGTGEGDAYAITATEQLLLWATEAQNRLARLCVPIPDVAAVQPTVAGASSLGPYSQIAATSGRTMHQATQVMIAGRLLAPANMGFLTTGNWYPPDVNGNPTAWANNNSAIALSAYSTQPVFNLFGYFLPAALMALTQTIDTYLDDYCQLAMAFYVGWRVATKSQDNMVLAERAQNCVAEFASTVREIFTRLVSNDNTLSAIFTPQAITAQVEAMKQIIPKT